MKPQAAIPQFSNQNMNAVKESLQRSPKILTNKSNNENYFSLCDVNIQQVSRGPKMPAQYMRYTDTQMKQMTKNPPVQAKQLMEVQKNEPNVNTNQHKERNIKSACPISRIDRILGYKFNDDHLQNEAKMVQRDSQMPKGYTLYEKQVKTEANVNYKNPDSSQNNYFAIKNKGISSNIFSSKKDSNSNSKAVKTIQVREYRAHDIFGRKPHSVNPVSLPYSQIKESESAWLPTFISPTYYNHCTTQYSLVNPGVKNISLTKSQVKSTNKALNPSHRQKGFCEYFDLTRVTAPNINKDYLKFYNRPKSTFGKSKEICTNYYDSYNSYKDLCDKPFSTSTKKKY